jgi:alpha-aminoadipate carrier protein LysW
MAQCPECEAMVDVDAEEVEEGELVSCPECGMELEVVNTNPVELDLAGDEDEDDEDEDEDGDEEEDDIDDEEDDEMDYDDDVEDGDTEVEDDQ